MPTTSIFGRPAMYERYILYQVIDYWEYLLSFLYVVVIYVYFARKKNLAQKSAPEYRFFLWGLMAKIIGGLGFALVYFYYYKGGDTMAYHYSTTTLANLAMRSPKDYFKVMYNGNAQENFDLFDLETGWPFDYIFLDARTFMVIRLLSPLALVTFNSYIVMTVVLASVSYGGVWRCYRTMVGYFPELDGRLAVAFLFMPSVVFWGSGIVKDTFTFTAMCWMIHFVDRWFKKGELGPSLLVGLLLSAVTIITIKPYIFMALLPAMLAWLYYERISGLRNKLIKYTILPIGTVVMLMLSIYLLNALGQSLDKFSLDKALQTIVVSKEDMTRAHAYGSNYFDVGELDESWSSVLRASPVAVNAALFRPYLWESRNIVMVAAGLENAWLLYLVISILLMGPVRAFRMLVSNPLALMCIAFTLVFAFVIGISTPNFGALVRFKIPLVPLFITGLFIIRYLMMLERDRTNRGHSFDPRDYIHGDPSPYAQLRRSKMRFGK